MATIMLGQDGTRQPAPRAEAWALAGLASSMLLGSLGTSIANVALPTMAQAFDATFQQAQWVVIAYLLAITTVIVSVGRLGDLLGRRRLLLSGLALFAAASTLCGLAPSLGLLISARAMQGMGAAIMMALSMACVGEAVPRERTGSAMGLLGTMSAIGTALGPTVGGVLISGYGWPAIFLVLTPLGIANLLLVRRFLPADRRPEARVAFDHPGTLLLGLALAAYALAMTTGRGGFGMLNLYLLAAAVGGLGLFLIAEGTASAPLVRLDLFRHPVLGLGFATNALVTSVVMATLVVGPFYLSEALALAPAQVGLVMSIGPIAAAMAGLPAGRLVDRFGPARMIRLGLGAMLVGTIALPLMPLHLGIAGYIAPLVVITAGYAVFQAANNTAVMTTTDPSRRGVVSGLLNLSRNLGLITGASAMGAAFAFGAGVDGGTSAGPAAAAAGMRATFGVGTLLVAIAFALAEWAASTVRATAPRRAATTGTRA